MHNLTADLKDLCICLHPNVADPATADQSDGLMTGTGTAASVAQEDFIQSAAQIKAQFLDFTPPACDETEHEMNC